MRFALLFLLFSPVVSQTCSDLKVAYQDAGCCTSNSTSCTVAIPHCDSTTDGKVCYDGTDIVVKGLLDALGFSSSAITLKKHVIPDTNAAYDLGNAEYKIRHLFLSDN